MDRFWDIIFYLEDHWLVLGAVVVWTGAALGVALGTYDHWSLEWEMRRASRRPNQIRKF